MKNLFGILFCVLFINILPGFAQLELPDLFSDNMVLQRNSEVRIWGKSSERSVEVKGSWSEEIIKVKTDKQGHWLAKISTPEAGGPYDLKVASGVRLTTIENVMIGDVWLCSGQSNMEMPLRGFPSEPVANSNQEIMQSKNPNIRLISVPRKSTTIAQKDFEGSWREADISTSGSFSATAYYFAKLVNQVSGVPIGLLEVSYGGSNVEAWINADVLKAYPEIEIPTNDDAIGDKNRTPTVLFNGMLNPVIGYSIKGAIWYQGESNAERPLAYEVLFPEMVKLWRTLWGQGEFPFYFTQIAPFNYDLFYPAVDLPWFANSAYLRDAQRKSAYTIPNSGMSCLLDVGNMQTIHPMDKQTAGERLAWLALAKTYGFEGFGYETPDYDELNIQDSLVTIIFKKLPNGITSYGKDVTAFEVAGEDKIFYPARCNVSRTSVQVWSDEVKNPVEVRYAFTNRGPAQLFSTEGIPVSSFRTDDWDPNEVSSINSPKHR